MGVREIIVIDDCSTDNTKAVVHNLMKRDPKIKYWRLPKNEGQLAALRRGAREATSEWVALLDADDELTPNSIEDRVVAANEYKKTTGIKPQLIYGDIENGEFAKLKGYVYPYLCKELCLCPTITIMLGQECIPYLPVNGWNTDDQIVLAIGKYFHVLHCGAVVAVVHSHSSPSRKTNSARRVFEGACELVRDHRAEIFREQGIRRLALWWLRLLKSFINYQFAVATTQISAPQPTFSRRGRLFLLRVYRRVLTHVNLPLKVFLRRYFDNDFF